MTTLEQTIKIIADHCETDAAELSAASVLAELGDSLNVVEVIMEVEDEFEIVLRNADQCKTIGDLASQVETEITK